MTVRPLEEASGSKGPKTSKKPGSKPKSGEEARKNPNRLIPDTSGYPPGKRPCFFKGSGGPGLSKGGMRDWVRCTWLCGDHDVEERRWGNSDEVCKERVPTW